MKSSIKKFAAVFAAFAILVSFVSCGSENGVDRTTEENGAGSVLERTTIAAESEHYQVSVAMMNYYFNVSYNNYLYQVSAISGSDTMKTIAKSVDTRGTLYSQLMSSVRTELEETLAICEMADAAGIKLEKADYDEIDAEIQHMKDNKNSSSNFSSMSFDKYLTESYGAGVNESVVRECLGLNKLAEKYAESIGDADIESAAKEFKIAHNVGADPENPTVVRFFEDQIERVEGIKTRYSE